MQALARAVGWLAAEVRAGSAAPTSWFTVSLVGLISLAMLGEMMISAGRLLWAIDTFGLHASEVDWTSPHFLSTLVTNQFIHQAGGHFFFNALLLLLAGAMIEQRIGWRYTLGLWLLGAIFSNLGHLAFMPDTELALVGASGGIAALLGVAFVLGSGVGIPIRLKPGGRAVFTLTVSMAIGLWLTLQVFAFVQYLIVSPAPGTAYWAHLAGFAFGALAAATLMTTATWRLAERPFEAMETSSAGD